VGERRLVGFDAGMLGRMLSEEGILR
jgi:hypothetical protein